MQRGRPRLNAEERQRRQTMCRDWAAEIKLYSRLSSKQLAKELGYGSGNDDADGRAWRALASGSRAPSPQNFKRMTAKAVKNGWLAPLGYLRYRSYWNQASEDDSEPPIGDTGKQWRTSILMRTMLILLHHARGCGVDQEEFFSEAHTALGQMQLSLVELTDDEIERRARRIAFTTAEELLDGPEYPVTSLGTLSGQ